MGRLSLYTIAVDGAWNCKIMWGGVRCHLRLAMRQSQLTRIGVCSGLQVQPAPVFANRWAGQRRFAWLGNCVLSGVLALSLWAAAAAQTLTVGTADPVRYIADVKALTTAPMEGRGDGTQGLTRAARR